MERAIETRSWAFRIICTILAMILVDAYGMHREEHRQEGGSDEPFHFVTFWLKFHQNSARTS